jgi:hypothetical protein
MREPNLLAIGAHAAARLERGRAIDEAIAAQIDWSAAVAENGAALQPLAGGKFDVVLDDRLVRYFVVTPPEGTASLEELRSVATVRLGELFGSDPRAYEVAADWRAAGPFLCCAVPNTLKLALAQAAQGARGSVASMVPLFVRVANSSPAARSHSGWIVVRIAGWISAASVEHGAVRLIRSGALDPQRPLEPWLAQLALTCGQSVGTPIVLDADQPQNLPAAWRVMPHDRRDAQLLAALHTAEAV